MHVSKINIVDLLTCPYGYRICTGRCGSGLYPARLINFRNCIRSRSDIRETIISLCVGYRRGMCSNVHTDFPIRQSRFAGILNAVSVDVVEFSSANRRDGRCCSADDDGAELPAGFLPRPGASVSTSVREDNGGTAAAVAAALLLLLLLQSADAVTPPLPLPLPVPAPAPAPGSAPAPSVSAAAATSPVTSSVGGVVADGSHSPSATRPSREGQHRARFTGPRQKRHRVLNAADHTRVRAHCAGKRHL